MNNRQPYNEQELLLLLSQGDEAALEAIITKYEPVLAPFIYGFTKSLERTEEIIQDIFLQVWLARESMATINNLKSFLYVAAKHHSLNAIRSLVRAQKRSRIYGQLLKEQQVEEEPDPKLQWIEEVIASLPPQQQKVWILSKREGKKYAEIADELKVSKETVKSYLQLANEFIKKYMERKIAQNLSVLMFLLESLK